MKKLVLALFLSLCTLGCSASAFDSVFSTFRKLEGAEYVKVPGILVRLGASKVDKIDDLPMNMKITGIRVLEVPKADGTALEKAIKAAAKDCELMLEATDQGDKATIWLEPKGKKTYSKMIIYSDCSLVELSGKFSPK